MRSLTLIAGALVVAITINQGTAVDRIAEDYIKLVLAIGQHDSDYVDAYYGPPEWKKGVDAAKVPLEALTTHLAGLTAALDEGTRAC